MSCSYIKFNNKSSDEVLNTKLLLCHTDYSDDVVAISREIKKGETTYLKPRVSHYGVSYSEQPTFKVGFIKEDFSSFTIDDKRKINTWLTESQVPLKLQLFSDLWDSDIYWKCVVSQIDYVRYNHCSMVMVSFLCDSEFAYKDRVITYMDDDFIIPCESDLDDLSYIYPVLKLTPKQTSDLTITNVTDGKYFKIKGLEKLDITIDCQNYMLSDNAGNVLNIKDIFIEDDDYDLYWFRLLMGNNRVTIEGGECEFTVLITNMLKVGVPDEFSVQ